LPSQLEMNTSHHHVGVIKGSPQGGYCCELLDHEFNYSDQLETVISVLYGHEIAEHAHFHVDGHQVPHHSLLDLYQDKVVTITYNDPKPDPSRVGSFHVPKLEPHQTPSHHVRR